MSDQAIARRVNPDGSTTLALHGSLSIETSAEFQKMLSEALDESPLVVLDTRELESIDLLCMQVICSGCRTAAAMGRGLELVTDGMPECVVTLGKSIGAPQGLPCAQNNSKPCIWYGGI